MKEHVRRKVWILWSYYSRYMKYNIGQGNVLFLLVSVVGYFSLAYSGLMQEKDTLYHWESGIGRKNKESV